MIKKMAALGAAAIALPLLTFVVPAQAADPAPTVVSITFDDTYADTIPALNAMQSRGIPGTLYVNSQRVGFSSDFLTRNQLKAYSQNGFEVGGHALNHEDLTVLTPEDAKANICADRTNLINLGYRVTSFAYPFGAQNQAIQQAAADCGYNSARTTSGLKWPYACSECATAESIPPLNPYAIRAPSSVQASFSREDMQSLVTQAEENGGGWVPLVFHHACATLEGCPTNGILTEDFIAFLDWLKQRPASTTIKTVDAVIGGDVKPPTDGEDPVPDPDLVIIGARQHAIDGVNAKRTANSMILYTRVSGTSTKTNPYGTEVAIVGGVVVKVETSVGNMAIPTGGVVLSGHGTSATWLRNWAKVGTAVQIHNYDEEPPPPPPTVVVPKTNVVIGSANRPVTGTNVYRAANSMVVFTSDGDATGTNAYGYEVAVVDGKVVKVEDSVGNMAIPDNGYVLSGHGTSYTWLKTNAVVGATVVPDGNTPPPPPVVVNPTTNVTIGSQSHAVLGVNVYRSANSLVVYTNANATTGANAYGYEVSVVDGKVVKVENNTGNMAIPANGYVLSGHGTSDDWLAANAVVGATVTP